MQNKCIYKLCSSIYKLCSSWSHQIFFVTVRYFGVGFKSTHWAEEKKKLGVFPGTGGKLICIELRLQHHLQIVAFQEMLQNKWSRNSIFVFNKRSDIFVVEWSDRSTSVHCCVVFRPKCTRDGEIRLWGRWKRCRLTSQHRREGEDL